MHVFCTAVSCTSTPITLPGLTSEKTSLANCTVSQPLPQVASITRSPGRTTRRHTLHHGNFCQYQHQAVPNSTESFTTSTASASEHFPNRQARHKEIATSQQNLTHGLPKLTSLPPATGPPTRPADLPLLAPSHGFLHRYRTTATQCHHNRASGHARTER